MAYATLIVEIPNSPADTRADWQSLRDGLFSTSKNLEGTSWLSENCAVINLSLALPFFSEAVFYCSSNNLRYSVLITESEQRWVTS